MLLLRHAETSAPDVFHGAESDVGLGARGHRQAVAVAGALAAENPAALFSSGMRRALQTADVVARACGLVVRVEAALHERRMGPLSGMSRETGLAAYAEAKARWRAGELDYTHEGGESFEDVRARVVPVVQAIAEAWVGRTVVVVAHGVVMRVLLTTLLPGYGPVDFERFAIDNAAVNDLRWDSNVWTAVDLNRKDHLDADGDVFAW